MTIQEMVDFSEALAGTAVVFSLPLNHTLQGIINKLKKVAERYASMTGSSPQSNDRHQYVFEVLEGIEVTLQPRLEVQDPGSSDMDNRDVTESLYQFDKLQLSGSLDVHSEETAESEKSATPPPWTKQKQQEQEE